MEFYHVPVLSKESISALNIVHGGVYVDATLGGAGHSSLIAEKLQGEGRLIGIDQDINAIIAAKERLSDFGNVTYINSNFKHIVQILKDLSVGGINGALMDLGVSSHQLDTPERGFTYKVDAPLDMRMDVRRSFSAYNVINEYSEEKLEDIIFKYGEERWARRIAEFIVKEREIEPVKTTSQLVEIIKKAVPLGARKEGPHPAKRTFQAIRIEVNAELSILKQSVTDFAQSLLPGGRLAVITFHSLEDRIVKNVFTELAAGCVCPKDFPICVCNKKPVGKIITKRPVVAKDKELSENPRSRSAKLRVFERGPI